MADQGHKPTPPKLLLTAREAAAALSMSERTLWGLTHSGEIPAIRIGRSVRYSVAALAQWIARRQAAAVQAAAGQHAEAPG
jgi:excisionase family DNA binding protein